MMLKLQYLVFSTALVSKHKIGCKFYVRKLAGVNGRKKVENPCYKVKKRAFKHRKPVNF